MVHVKSCWTPCFWHGNVFDGSIAVSIYSLAMSVCVITYTSYVMNGGDSSQLWLPYFEANLDTTIQSVGIFVIIYFILLVIMSVLLLHGIWSSIRGFMLPWVYFMYIVILFQAMFGLWLIFGYYIYLEMIFAALCDGLWMCLHIYCVSVVKSHYRNLTMIQSPDIEYLNTY
jgi:hypothetical protein